MTRESAFMAIQTRSSSRHHRMSRSSSLSNRLMPHLLANRLQILFPLTVAQDRRLTNPIGHVSGNLPRMKTLCVFCGSNFGADPAYRASAIKVGSLLAARGITLVYGGGKVGMMGALADSCLSAGGCVLGIIPKSLAAKEIAHQSLTEL